VIFSKPREAKYSLIPVTKEYDTKNFILHRVKLPSIEITSRTRDSIENAMALGSNFIRVGDHTIMINSIAGIDPLSVKIKAPVLPETKPLTKTERETNIKRIAEIKEKLIS